MRKIFIILIFFSLVLSANTQESKNLSRWSIETSLSFPIHQIYLVKASYKVWEKGEILFGPCYQNWKNEEGFPLGRAHAITLILGYRQYLWKGINLEIEFFPAYNVFNSSFDNNTYKGFEMWVEYRVGYKIQFKTNFANFYFNIQPGIGHAIFLQNIWPDLDKDNYQKNSLGFIPQIAFGINF